MREAMAKAEVGDDVYGEDPSVNRLQERVAALLGKQAALFFPSGTMANQAALRAHTRPGEVVLASRDCHILKYEGGAASALSGLQIHTLGANGWFDANELHAALPPNDPHFAPATLVAIENTHNVAGGTLFPADELARVVAAARAAKLALHLDGARLWNAAVASRVTERELAHGFDSISVCLSKGLGAPAGSVVAGTRDLIRRCHRFRKMHGGGMRQAGILAAAGLHAIEHHRERLAEDHANARALAEALVGAKHLAVDVARVQTNIVMIDLEHGTADAVIAIAREDGILLGAAGPRRIRAVTHLDVDRDAVLRAAKTIAEIAAAL